MGFNNPEQLLLPRETIFLLKNNKGTHNKRGSVWPYNRGSGWQSSILRQQWLSYCTLPFPSIPHVLVSPSHPIPSHPACLFPHPENPLAQINQGQHSLQAGRANSCYHCPLPPPICLPNFLNLLIHPANKIVPARSHSPSSSLQKGTWWKVLVTAKPCCHPQGTLFRPLRFHMMCPVGGCSTLGLHEENRLSILNTHNGNYTSLGLRHRPQTENKPAS